MLGLSLLIVKGADRLGRLSSKYATPSLDGTTYTSIWRVVGMSGAGVGALWVIVALVYL